MKKHTKTKYGTNSTGSKSAHFQEGDVSSKRIFRNPLLCAQFLRTYSGLDILKNVQAEDIELVKVRYHIFGETELNSDSVVRVWTGKSKGELPLYIVPLIEHKSSVDYNVAMQLLTYMLCIWKDWEKEMKEKHHLDCKSRDFLYPFIFPIVYFEGAGNWTADTQLSKRIFMGDAMKKYIPDFSYQLVCTHDYTNKELLEKKDEMSLLMMLNKIQRAEDLGGFQDFMTQEVDALLKDTPESVVDIIAGTAQSLCRKLNVPEEETTHYISKLRKERKMGYLFENMEKMDIQLERRLRKEAEERADKAEAAAQAQVQAAAQAAAQAKAQAQAQAKAQAKAQAQAAAVASIRSYIEALQEVELSRFDTAQKLRAKFSLTEEAAEENMLLYWREQTDASADK